VTKLAKVEKKNKHLFIQLLIHIYAIQFVIFDVINLLEIKYRNISISIRFYLKMQFKENGKL
jgi:hypothetical protein